MTQNLRLATFIPTTDDADAGEGVIATGPSSTGKVIPTVFAAASGGGGGGGIPEAPIDSTTYARKSANWTPAVGEAPNDGLTYARHNDAWVPIATSLPGVIDGGTF
jgi:hypothetical protein